MIVAAVSLFGLSCADWHTHTIESLPVLTHMQQQCLMDRRHKPSPTWLALSQHVPSQQHIKTLHSLWQLLKHPYNQLHSSFRQPHPVHSPPGSPHLAYITSSQLLSSLISSIANTRSVPHIPSSTLSSGELYPTLVQSVGPSSQQPNKSLQFIHHTVSPTSELNDVTKFQSYHVTCTSWHSCFNHIHSSWAGATVLEKIFIHSFLASNTRSK